MDDFNLFDIIETIFSPFFEIFKYIGMVILAIGLYSNIFVELPLVTTIVSWAVIVIFGVGFIKSIALPIYAKIVDDDDENEGIVFTIISSIFYYGCLVASVVCCFFQTQLCEILHVTNNVTIYMWIAVCLLVGELANKILCIIPDIIAAFVIDPD